MVWITWALIACRHSEDPDPSPTGHTGLPDDLVVVASERVLCADPSRRDEAVFDLVTSRAEPDKVAWFFGGGIITGDLDGDGHYEVILPGLRETFLYRSAADGSLTDATDELAGLPLIAGSGGSVADYDGDGDLDVIYTRYQAPNVLLRNDDGVLVDVTEGSGLSMEPRRTMASSWGDVDRDGDLDLFLGNYGFIDQSGDDPDHASFAPADPSWLYLNDGDGTFTDVSDRLPAAVHDGYTFSGGFLDVDVDGWPELYVVNDFGNSYPNVLMRNVEGELVLGEQEGLDVAITGMGLGVGDVNADGLPDVAMTAWNGNSFLWSSSVGWVDHTQAAGLVNDLGRTQKVAWGVELLDADNDGDLDVPMSYGYLDSTYTQSQRQPDAMYLQAPEGKWVDVGPAWGFNHPTIGRGFAAADFDGDGWLDYVKRDLGGPSLYLRTRCGEASWLRVRLHDDTSMNRFAVGARVEIVSRGVTQWRTVFAGTINHAAGGPPEVHFGLGQAERVERLVVHWPDGRVDTLRDVDARRILDIIRTP